MLCIGFQKNGGVIHHLHSKVSIYVDIWNNKCSLVSSIGFQKNGSLIHHLDSKVSILWRMLKVGYKLG